MLADENDESDDNLSDAEEEGQALGAMGEFQKAIQNELLKKPKTRKVRFFDAEQLKQKKHRKLSIESIDIRVSICVVFFFVIMCVVCLRNTIF